MLDPLPATRTAAANRLEEDDLLPPAGLDAPTRRESCVETGFGAGLVLAAVALAVAFPGHADPVVAAAMVVAYAVVSRVVLSAGLASTTPTQLVFVPMLFIGAPGVVPLLVLAGTILHRAPELTRARWRPDRLAGAAADAWYAVPPTLVFLALSLSGPDWGQWAALLAVLAAQLVGGNAIWLLRRWLGRGTAPDVPLSVLAGRSAVDACLASVGLVAAAAAADLGPYAFTLVLPLAGLLAVLAHERTARIEQALELSGAYRGTALMLGDLLEHADGNTGGEHTRGVVDLATRVAGELGLGAGPRRNVEFAALLHDVGKIAIPREIITKPGRLNEDDWALIKTHTIAGQRMLDRVGGPLREVGRIVRASHERWDGGGYPDGLAGSEIPREASVVAVCDAFSAMTTERSYRRARSIPAALEELRRCAGTQFDPDVVEATGRTLLAPSARGDRAAAAGLGAQMLSSSWVASAPKVPARS